MIAISSCYIQSSGYESYPNGKLTASGSVDYFTNKIPMAESNPVKVRNISVENQNGAIFFTASELGVYALRGIARGLFEIADKAEEAQKKLLELNA